MTTKINSVTIVYRPGSQEYRVGIEYNGLLLDHIKDNSIEYPDCFFSIYQGFTKDNELVFEARNSPTDVMYIEDK